MKPERWRQIDQLFHSALQYDSGERSAFLDEACAGDEPLRKHIEALLAAHVGAGSFMESSALEVEARSLAGQNESLVGQTIGHYKIISSIGVGGMGEVYLAQDTTLGRKVALKLLPAAFTQDSDHVRRFQQEARAASALNHPNIITIHEIGRAGDIQFIATEFIDGETLRQRIISSQSPSVQDRNRYAEKGIQLSAVLSIGMQVADALAAAHAKGIVHRDIKPENIILVEDSHLQQQESFVKVLDFGIAKLAEHVSESGDEATTKVMLNTHEGSVMGTAGYMSPEQARGEKVDGRTDIWSLGIVLYEMLSNALPFGGDTAQDVIASILKEEPPPLPLEVPDRLKWIVEKALRKNREERYQTAREMFSDLRGLLGQLREIESPAGRSLSVGAYVEPGQARVVTDHGPAVTTTSSPAGTISSAEYIAGGIKRLGKWAVVGLAALVIGLGGLALGLYKYIGWNQSQNKLNQTKPAPFQNMKITRLTSTGKAGGAAISPDGKYVVHAVDDGEQASLWMRQVLTSSNVQINPPANVSYPGLTFSPDGDYLYYISWDKKSSFVLYQMPVLGGASRKLITNIDSNVSFSPDGKQFAFVRGEPAQGEVALLLANADGTAERKLVTHRMRSGVLPGAAWSPDGKIIAYPVNISDESVLHEVRVDDGSEKPISPRRWWRIGQVAWLRDGSGIVMNAIEHASGPTQIWYLSYPDGQAHRITNDLNNYRGVSLTADSSALVTVESEQHSNIWIAPNDNARRAIQITHSKSDGAEGISWTPDGKIVYATRAGGNLDLWITDVDGTRQKQLTANAGNNGGPSVSPDGRYVVFVSDRTGTSHVWRSDIDGSNPRQLTNGDGEWVPKCSPDGRWVLYHLGFGKSGIWKVPIDGGESVQIIENASGGLSISPDGKWILTAHYEPNAVKSAIYPFDGGEPHKILDIFFGFIVRWTPDGSAIAYVERRNPSTINSQNVEGGTPKRLSDFSPDRIFSFAWSPDGKQLAIARGAVSNDVVLIRDFRSQQ